MDQKFIRKAFVKAFGDAEDVIVGRAPGRVNLIGEHTDYNDGFVFPMAVEFSIWAAARRRADGLIRIYSADYDKMAEVSADGLRFNAGQRWSNYPLGVVWALREAGVPLSGFEMAFGGDIPQGAGLSSSAALEIVVAVVLQRLWKFSMPAPDLARLCQRAENDFVGMNCGIMDQFVSMMGRRDHALFLDCRSLVYEHVPLKLGDYRIVICQSGVKHSLVDSEYNKRRAECEAGAAVIARHFPGVAALRDADLRQLEHCRDEMDPTVYRRCRHVVTENGRVLESVAALRSGDLKRFGELMNCSHDSLRDDYEVSCAEIDLLVRLAREVPGVLGSRITGGGFGGCTVNLMAGEAVAEFSRLVLPAYRARTGIEPRLFVSAAANGAEIVE